MRCLSRFFAVVILLLFATSVELFASTSEEVSSVSNINSLSGYSVPSVEVKYDDLTPDALWDMANAAYANSDFLGAEKAYQAILGRDMHSAELYYNLGNTYYRNGSVGRALLYLYKAQKLAPSDRDIAHNIEVVKLSAVDEIEELPELFVKRWAEWVSIRFSAFGWTVLSLVSLALSLSFVLLFIFAQGLGLRRLGLSLGLLFMVLFGLATSYALSASAEILEPSEAVVLRKRESVRSAPDRSSAEIFQLHEGTKVSVEREFDDWCEVRIGDGKQGWVRLSSLGKI